MTTALVAVEIESPFGALGLWAASGFFYWLWVELILFRSAVRAKMVEEIQKIRAEELSVIRLVFPDSQDSAGETVELTLAQAKAYAGRSHDTDVRRHLCGIIDGLAYFSKKGVQPSVEFVVPISRR
jgi:hypothetical protein